ncbi:MAG: hypothetical protein Q8S57_09805 [Methanoregula sp.]|nr:hypothetical protein [Methanoregula sp.]
MTGKNLFISIILIVLVFAGACTENTAPVQLAEQRSLAPPGQPLVAIGEIIGVGQLGGVLVSGTIDTITFKVGLAQGEKSINMENVTIIYGDAIRTETLVPVEGYRGSPPQGAWGIIEVKNEIGNPNNRLDDNEQFIIQINPKAPLVPRQLITIAVQPPFGKSLILRRIAPSTIMAENNILTIV